jgi:exonuclease III
LSFRINDALWTLVAVYGPNNDEPQFFTNLQRKIESLDNSSVIIGGDWNVPLLYEDSVLEKSQLSQAAPS